MHYASDAGSSPILFEHLEKIIQGVRSSILWPAMDQDRPLARGSDQELADEPLPLDGMGCALVIVIKPDLAPGNHLRLAQQVVKLCQRRVVGLGRIVRINART